MEIKDYFQILKNRKKVLIYTCLIFIVLGASITFIQPLKYEAKSRLLIVQNVSGVDPYTISKSNQYLSSLFSQIVYSNSFFELVTNTNNFDINKDYFSATYKKQMNIWQKTISAQSNDAGIIEISIYHPNSYQAKQIALGVNDILINQGFNYQGSGEGVKMKIIDQPLLSNYPVKPNIIFNFIAFSLLGILAGLIYLYFFPNKRRGAQQIEDFIKDKSSVRPVAQNYYQAAQSQNIHPSEISHPAEKVMVHELASENNEEIKGNMQNIINRF